MTDAPTPATDGRIGNVRWTIAALLGVGTIINYFDRVNLSVATTGLTQEFGLTQTQIGLLLSSYLWTYTLLQIPIGALLDRLGVKWLVRVGTCLWAVASFLTAVANGFGLIVLSRLILGIGESPTFPGNAKATGYWFPVRERGLATASFDAAAKCASALGLPTISLVVAAHGWRAGFWVTGILSVVYAAAFWLLYRDPQESRRLAEPERRYIAAGGAQKPGLADTGAGAAGVAYLLGHRKVWGLTLGFTAYNYSLNLFLVWLPGYLQKQLGVSVLKTGLYLILPWLVATLTDFFVGGLLVDRLIAQGHDPARVRKIIVTAGLILGMAAAGAAFTQDVNVAVIWLTLSLAGLAAAAPVFWSIPALIAPKGAVGTLGGIMNFSGNLAGVIAPIVAGVIADRLGFAPNFLLTASLLVGGIFCFVLLTGALEPIPSPDRS